MRADRLLSLLMLLQTRGRLTARKLSAELEVSVRTIYRDMDALSAAGVPVYADAGPGGGYALLENYRTSLTGMSSEEVRALFMLSVPDFFADLGLNTDLRGALLKLAAALPDRLREDEAFVRQRFLLDPAWWDEDAGSAPHLRTVQAAIWADEKLAVSYSPIGKVHISIEIAPHALVVKAGSWYVVCEAAGGMRVLKVADLLEVRRTGQPFIRREDLNLREFWKQWCGTLSATGQLFEVRVRVRADALAYLQMGYGEAIAGVGAGEADPEGWVERSLRFASLLEARSRLLGIGSALEVLAPESLRRSMQDVASQVVRVYRG